MQHCANKGHWYFLFIVDQSRLRRYYNATSPTCQNIWGARDWQDVSHLQHGIGFYPMPTPRDDSWQAWYSNMLLLTASPLSQPLPFCKWGYFKGIQFFFVVLSVCVCGPVSHGLRRIGKLLLLLRSHAIVRLSLHNVYVAGQERKNSFTGCNVAKYVML